MAKASVSVRVPADADEVWDFIGDFARLDGWAPGVAGCVCDGRDVGCVRTVETADGRRRRERLESLDEVGRSYSYSLLDEAAAPHCVATLKVWSERNGGAEVVWSVESADDGEAACREMEALFRAALENVRSRFA